VLQSSDFSADALRLRVALGERGANRTVRRLNSNGEA